ncbi:MAG TPA: hypothetical protein VNE63_13390 [Candidatus Acidoferrales bacterium]|nr:hypothetical protein [Candidatus Acidoferrales bacterium]
MAGVISKLLEISTAPTDKEAFERWIGLEDAIAFLKQSSKDNEFVIYACTKHTFLHAVVVPAASVDPPNIEDLLRWDHNPFSSWGILVSFGEPTSVSIAQPLRSVGADTLEVGEQLLFARTFDGRIGKKTYYEVLQKFTHAFGLHYVEARMAYCRLDKHGDIEDVIRIVEIPARGTEFGGTIVTFNRALLDEYLVLTDSTIVRMFDFTRCRYSEFSGWSGSHDSQCLEDPILFYRSHIEPGHASYMRGCQIVRTLTSRETVIKRHDLSQSEEREYASFIAHDWKNKIVREISTAPGETTNYFTKSELPFETSPAFFRPEVLTKYKADSEKYRLEERSISCRGGWSLQTYDINEAGQIHTYIVYLRNLPYEEQLYWKAHNEKPQKSISKRAFETDFEGKWHQEYDPLESLKGALHDWNRLQVPWWELRAEKLPDQVHYSVTSSHDEWANEILHLDQFVIEGFETKWLRNEAQRLGRSPDARLQSLSLVEECLIGMGYADNDARKIFGPLKNAHHLRSKLRGHASGNEAEEIRNQILAEYGSYNKHFRALAEVVDQSIRAIGEAFDKCMARPSPD